MIEINNKSRLSKNLEHEALTHGINTSLITDLVEQYITKRYPDISNYEFLERLFKIHIEEEKKISYSDAGLLGYFIKDNEIHLCQIEIYQYKLSFKGKKYIKEHNIPAIKGFDFSIIIGIELDKSFNPIYGDELFQLFTLRTANDILNELLLEANLDGTPSKFLSTNEYVPANSKQEKETANICISDISEPKLLYQKLLEKNQNL